MVLSLLLQKVVKESYLYISDILNLFKDGTCLGISWINQSLYCLIQILRWFCITRGPRIMIWMPYIPFSIIQFMNWKLYLLVLRIYHFHEIQSQYLKISENKSNNQDYFIETCHVHNEWIGSGMNSINIRYQANKLKN